LDDAEARVVAAAASVANLAAQLAAEYAPIREADAVAQLNLSLCNDTRRSQMG
jgi:hypothetical protein